MRFAVIYVLLALKKINIFVILFLQPLLAKAHFDSTVSTRLYVHISGNNM